MWFWFAIIALICWSGSDLFSKIGCQDGRDKYSHLKMVMAVGLVMGLHAAYEIFVGGVEISWQVILTYLPVSALYIVSMAIGYLGLRYIELSISSPICNSSGAIVAILCICTAGLGSVNGWQLAAMVLVCAGVIGLGVVQMTEDDALRAARMEKENIKYTKSLVALLIPVIYCLLDALGTFADSVVLETLNEDSANVAYELTFFAVGIVCAVYVLGVRRQKLVAKMEAPKYVGAVFETAGQLAYIYALNDSAHVMFSAPIISAYCALSVVWGRLFLKERLTWKHYLAIAVTVVGIVILGLFDEL
ncbi:MAG: EamA family transporter [Faecousia sp.]